MEMNFCRRCGTKLKHVENHVYKCENEHIIFANVSPSVGVFILTKENDVLFSVRGIEPHKGMLDAFGGFVDGEETFEETVTRELKEELDLDPSDYEPVRYLCSGIGHYPYKGETISIISSFYWTRLATEKPLVAQDDVAEIKKVPLNHVDFAQLHDDDIGKGVEALQNLSRSNLL